MKTSDFIDALARNATPVRRGVVERGLLTAAAVGAAAALVVVVGWLKLRPDLAAAAGTMSFWMKAGYAAALTAAGFFALDRLARPAGSPRRGAIAAALVLGLTLAVGLTQLMMAPAPERMHDWLGGSWKVCPVNILLLSIPMLIASLLVVRRFAPTQLAAAGAACGLFSGATAALIYGLHCTETTAAFLGTWYGLGVLLTAALGALLGPRALRW